MRPARQKVPRVSAGRAGAVMAALLAVAAPVRADVIDLVWTPAGSFERRLSVAPGKFAELCGALAKGQSVQWSYEAGSPLDFNIHYHRGQDVVYPTRASGLARSDGTLVVDAAQDYCWMWSNKSSGAVDLKVQLQRR